MIIKDYKELNIIQIDEVVVAYKLANNKNSFNEVDKVVTEIYFYNLDRELIYKINMHNNYIYLNKEGYHNFNDIIHDLSIYVTKCELEKYWKDITVNEIINNNFRGTTKLKRFIKEYYEQIEHDIKVKELESYIPKVKELENELNVICNSKNIRVCKNFNDNLVLITTKYDIKRMSDKTIFNNFINWEYDNNYKLKVSSNHKDLTVVGWLEYNGIIQYYNDLKQLIIKYNT